MSHEARGSEVAKCVASLTRIIGESRDELIAERDELDKILGGVEIPHARNGKLVPLVERARMFREAESVLRKECDQLITQKDEAYAERNLVVALLAEYVRTIGFDGAGEAFIAPHVGEDWGEEWKWVLFLEIPGLGQVSWHLRGDEIDNFPRIERRDVNLWDGHTTAEKYDRIRRFCRGEG